MTRGKRVVRVDVIFFQAEDGIRDIGVTGVQTCALPIFAVDRDATTLYGNVVAGDADHPLDVIILARRGRVEDDDIAAVRPGEKVARDEEIGRASCRERV